MQRKNMMKYQKKREHFGQKTGKKSSAKLLADYKKGKDERPRQYNDWGLEQAKRDVQNGSKIIGESKKATKKFEEEIGETHKTFLKRIDEAFEFAKDETDTKIIDTFYEGLDNYHSTNRDLRTVHRTWHDLRLSINLKFIEMAKEMGKKYPGCITCLCKKCQDTIGLENIKKAKKRIVPGLLKNLKNSL